MTTEVESELRQALVKRGFGFGKQTFENFREVDLQVMQIGLDVAFCGVAKAADIAMKATEAGISLKTVRAALQKMDGAEMIFPCTDPHTGIECVEFYNFDDTSLHKEIDEMQSLE